MPIYLIGVGTTACKFTVGGTDLTSMLRSITINQEFDDVDITAMNAVSHAHAVGLRDDSWDLELYQNFDSSSTDASFYTLLGASSGTTFVYQTNASTVTATMPKYTLVGNLFSYPPIDGAVGDVSILKVTVKPAAGQYTQRGTS